MKLGRLVNNWAYTVSFYDGPDEEDYASSRSDNCLKREQVSTGSILVSQDYSE